MPHEISVTTVCSYCGGGQAGHRSYCIYHEERTCPTCRQLNEAQIPIDRMVYANNRGRMVRIDRRSVHAPIGEVD